MMDKELQGESQLARLRRGVLITLVLASAALALPAAPAGAATISSATGPLTKVNITTDLNCEVDHIADTHTEFYGGSACATLLASGGRLYGPQRIPAGGDAGSTGGANPRSAWTPVAQEGPSGGGTSADPYRVTTVVEGGPFRVTEVVTYVLGEESYRSDVTVANTGEESADVILYRAGDCYLQNSDYGYGRIDGDAPTCVAQAPGGGLGDRIEQFTPITAGSRHMQAGYWEIWEHIGSQQPFPNTCRCNDLIDNGAGISWNRTIPPGHEARLASLVTFSPVGTVPVVIHKTADDDSVEAGGATGYTIRVENPNVRDVTLEELNDDLPEGFTYLKGSTSGATTADPQINGRRLTWANLVVPANGSIAVHFMVRVSDVPGTYVDTASGKGAGVVVVPAEEAAPLPVTEAKLERPDLFLQKDPDEAVLIAASHNGYTITVANPGDRSVPLSRITEVLADGLSYVAGSTTGVTEADPAIEGQRLTWELRGIEVPAFSAVKLHFLVRVPVSGVVRNPLVSAVSPGGRVEQRRDTAPIQVRRPTVGALRLRKSPDRRRIRAGEKVRFTLALRDLAPKTGTTAHICDRLPRQLRLVSAPGARVMGRQLCWRRPLPAGVVTVHVSYLAKAASDSAGRAASTAEATAPAREPARGHASVDILPLLAPPPIVTG
jgi:hypothetical protein